jgi:hypothetical protein
MKGRLPALQLSANLELLEPVYLQDGHNGDFQEA